MVYIMMGIFISAFQLNWKLFDETFIREMGKYESSLMQYTSLYIAVLSICDVTLNFSEYI